MGRVSRYIRHQYIPLKISRESLAREDTMALEDEGFSVETTDSQRLIRRKSISPSLGKNEGIPTDFLQAVRSSDTDTETAAPADGWRQFKVSPSTCNNDIT